MKKVKLAFIATAILLSVGGAFATRAHSDCRYATQYWYNGAGFIPAGQYGVNYICEESPATCTYIQVGENWETCQLGTYTPAP